MRRLARYALNALAVLSLLLTTSGCYLMMTLTETSRDVSRDARYHGGFQVGEVYRLRCDTFGSTGGELVVPPQVSGEPPNGFPRTFAEYNANTIAFPQVKALIPAGTAFRVERFTVVSAVTTDYLEIAVRRLDADGRKWSLGRSAIWEPSSETKVGRLRPDPRYLERSLGVSSPQ